MEKLGGQPPPNYENLELSTETLDSERSDGPKLQPMEIEDQESKEDLRKRMMGIFWGVFSALLFSFNAPIVKILYEYNPGLSLYEILYWKSLSMMLMNYLLVKSYGENVIDIPVHFRNLVVVRAFCGFFGLGGKWGSAQLLPVSVATCLMMTHPILTAILSRFLLDEQMNWVQIFSLIVSFLGVLVLTDPVHASSNISSDNSVIIGTIFGLVSAMGASGASVCMRMMNKGIHFSVSPFWFASGCTFVSPIFHLGFSTHRYSANPNLVTESYDSKIILLISIISVVQFIGQVAISKAF